MSYKARFLKCLITNTEQACFTSTQFENFTNTLTGAFYEHVAVVVYAICKLSVLSLFFSIDNLFDFASFQVQKNMLK